MTIAAAPAQAGHVEFAPVRRSPAGDGRERFANPLTQLPGSPAIDEHIERLLAAGVPFTACDCELSHFKPFNGAYGHRRGDDMIRLVAAVLAEACSPTDDFLGHAGGDGFVLLFQSPAWETRCNRALATFDVRARELFAAPDLANGGFRAEDRSGRLVLFPLTTLVIGAVPVEPGELRSHLEILAAAAEAKRQAKRRGGSTLFFTRRRAASLLTP